LNAHTVFYEYGADNVCREVAHGFPVVGTLFSSRVRKLAAVFQSFPADAHTALALALVKDRNPAGASALNQTSTEAERTMVKEFRARFSHVPMADLQSLRAHPTMRMPEINMGLLDGSYRPVINRPPRKADIQKEVLTQLRENHARRVVKRGESEYEIIVAREHVLATVALDFGGWDQLRFDYSLGCGDSTPQNGQHFSLGDILGFCDLPTDELSLATLASRVTPLVNTICLIQEDLLEIASR